jgi:hypothetical protein
MPDRAGNDPYKYPFLKCILLVQAITRMYPFCVFAGRGGISSGEAEHPLHSPLQPGAAEHEKQHGHRRQDDAPHGPRDAG